MPFAARLRLDDVNHLGLDILRVDSAGWRDPFGHHERQVSASGPDVCDEHPRLQVERLHQDRGGFLRLPFGTIKPIGGFVPHHLSDLPPHVEDPDPVRIVNRPSLVTRILGDREEEEDRDHWVAA